MIFTYILLGVIAYCIATVLHGLIGFTGGEELDETSLLSNIGVSIIKNYAKYPLLKMVICKLCFSGHIGTVLGLSYGLVNADNILLYIVPTVVGYTMAYIYE